MIQGRNARVELADAPGRKLLRLVGERVEARLRQIDAPQQRWPFVLQVAELSSQIIKTRPVRLVVDDAQHRGALRPRPLLEIMRRGGHHAVDGRADRDNPRIDDSLDARGHEQSLKRHPSKDHDQSDANAHLHEPATPGAQQQSLARRDGGNRISGRTRRVCRRFRDPFGRVFVKCMREGRSKAARIKPGRAVQSVRIALDRMQRRAIFRPLAWLGSANKNCGFAGRRFGHKKSMRRKA